MASEGWHARDARHLALSDRQVEVLDLLAEGYTNAEIGAALGISADGAKWHVSEIISKLSVANREEAGELWRSERRGSSRGRLVRWFAATPALAWGAGAVMVIGVAGIALAMVSAERGENSSAQPTVPATTAAPTPTVQQLTAEEIVVRSEDEMAAQEVVRVEHAVWSRREIDGPPAAVEVREYRREGLREMRVLATDEPDGSVCGTITYDVPPVFTRGRGALAIYEEPGHQDRGASAPEPFEMLGETTFEGTPAWIVRYAFSYPSIETPVLVERTEWIAKDDFTLLKAEIEQFDDFGFQGQFVEVYTYGEPAEECPVEPRYTIEDLRPTTEPRLESPLHSPADAR